MKELEGRVALVTGAARGQGRAHAIRLAADGADIIATDLCGPVDGLPYPMPTEGDLEETARMVRALKRRVVTARADVRDPEDLQRAVDDGVGRFGRLDIVVANAGIVSFGRGLELSLSAWGDVIDTNLTGVWHTCRAAVPAIFEGGAGGVVILTSSSSGLRGSENVAHYTAAKHGVIGLMKTLANELGPSGIRVNCVCPAVTRTEMTDNQATYELFCPDEAKPTREHFLTAAARLNSLPVPWVEAEDVANAVAFLVSDAARFITGVTLPIDAGYLNR